MAQATVTRTNMQREQYAEWLQGYRWDAFLTSTFRRPRKEPYYALQAVRGELERHNVVRGFLAAEPHQSGDLHIHGIVAGSIRNGHSLMDSPTGIWEGLFKRFGRAKVEPCNNHEAVTMYCSKYLLKQQSRVCDFYEVFGNRLAWKRGELEQAQTNVCNA